MWIELVIAVFYAVALLYAPGYLLLRVLRFSRVVALCAAPVCAVCAYAVLPIVYYELGVACSVATVALPVFVAGGIAYAVSRARGTLAKDVVGLEPLERIRAFGRTWDFDALWLAAYVLVAVLVCAWMFVANLPHADAFYSRFDNQTHLNLVRAFLDSGKWSSLHTSVYLASAPAAAPSSVVGGFYPAAWHDLVALVCSITGTSVALGTNALVIAVCALVLPGCMYVCMRALFARQRLAVQLGTVVTSAFAAYPWVFVVKGPTWPDMLGTCLLPAVFAVIMLFVDGALVHRAGTSLVVFACCAFVGMALIHPSGVFSAYVFFAAYGMHVLLRATKGMVRGRRVAFGAVYCLAIAAVWVGCYYLPLLKGILSYHHSENRGLAYALGTLGTFSLTVAREQPVLAVALLAGIVACVRRRKLWVLFAPAFFGLCYVATLTNAEPLKYWLAAMWYMTAYRFASRFVLFCVPVVAYGAQALATWLDGAVQKRLPARARISPRMALVAVLVACCAINYCPQSLYDRSFLPSGMANDEFVNDAAYGRVRRRIQNIYSDDVEHVYSAEEVAFVQKVVELIPQGALVINSPRDGSMWAYAINRLNAYYRKQTPSGETDDSVLIRTRLRNYARDPKVREAVRRTGAQYVLLLDKGVKFKDGVWLDQFSKRYVRSWRGIESIDESTSGFEVVLAEGDQMRLYKIEV